MESVATRPQYLDQAKCEPDSAAPLTEIELQMLDSTQALLNDF
jgi:hypothetical protein